MLVRIPKLNGADPRQQGNRNTVLMTASDMQARYKGIETLDENLWLLRVESGLPFFCNIVSLADRNQIPYRILVLEDEPKWLVFPKDT
jgi:hypothetical protein